MNGSDMSRRNFIVAGAGLVAHAAIPPSTSAALRAGQVIDRIKARIGIPWQAKTVDRIIAGNAATPVRGIATVMMATLDAIERAAASGRNMVITHEPTFYSHPDTIDKLKADSVFQYKSEFIRRNDMVVFRFHDHWHDRKPDGIAMGMTRELGWEKYAQPQDRNQFVFPDAPRLRDFAAGLRSRLKATSIRVLGDPLLPVHRVRAEWGFMEGPDGIDLLAKSDTDVVVCGETLQWEAVEYAQDAISTGKRKALIVLGHVVSEQAGMKYCAEWLKPIIPEISVEYLEEKDPYWIS